MVFRLQQKKRIYNWCKLQKMLIYDSNLYKYVRYRWYLKNIKTKNLEQNKDNLINYLSQDYSYNKESANKVIEKAVKENVVRIVLFNGKNS